MVIIGRGTNDDLIVRMSKTELANFAGFSSTYATGFDKSQLDVGGRFDVGVIYDDAVAVLEHHKIAIKAAKQLKASSTRFLSFFKTAEENKNG